MEKAFGALAKEANKNKKDDPRQAANLMHRLSEMTGFNMGKGMKEAL